MMDVKSWQMIGGLQVPVEAGSKLDLEVADRIFPGHELAPQRRCSGGCLPPNYSEDVEESWRIVEEMKNRGFSFALFEFSNISSVSPAPVAAFKKGVYAPDWSGDISWPGSNLTCFVACASSVSLSICLAAIKAISFSEPLAEPSK